VDNGGRDQGNSRILEALASEDRRVDLVKPRANLGYFGGADYALAEYLKTNPLPEWVAVTNPDITFPTRTFFKQLLIWYAASQPGVLAPAIWSALSGTDQNPYLRRRPSRARMHFYKWLFHFWVAGRSYQRLSLTKLRLQRVIQERRRPGTRTLLPERIYAPHGSFLLFHRSYFEAGGTFRYGTFLFGEEIFVAETARQLGLAIVHDRRLAVEHKQNTPSKILRDRALQAYAKDAAAFVAGEYF
jgi:GT2 family glycosyltransferase